jgi:hypothetical protein
MKTTMSVRTNEEETKAIIMIRFSGKGWDSSSEVEKMRKQFSDAETLGMKWTGAQYETEIDLTPENAEPFAKYAESKNIEIIM